MDKVVKLNALSIVAGSVAVAVACKVTKSPWCLMGLVLIPTFYYNSSERRK